MNGLAKFLAGVIVGGVAVALLTPVTGKELRERIKEVLKEKGLLTEENIDEVIEMIAAETGDDDK